MAPIAVTAPADQVSAPVVKNGTMNGTTTTPASSSSFGPNTCAALHGAKDLRIEERTYTPPTGDEVQIRVRATGLCGSDLHYYLHGRNGDFALQHSMCLGHESAGEIVALGPNVPASASLSVGDRVAIEAGRFCGSCPKCRDGRYNLCKQMRFASSAKTHPHLDGTLQKYMNWPSWLVHKLPANVSLTSAALCEPLSVVLQGIRRSALQPGQSVLVYGAGAVGLLACAAAKASGASFVAAVDIDEGRLAFAAANGWADATYLLPRGAPPAAVEESDARARRTAEDKAAISAAQTSAGSLLQALSTSSGAAGTTTGFATQPAPLDLSSEGFDVVFECTGVPSCVQTGIFATKAGGKVVLIGMGNPVQTLPIGNASLREVDIIGVFRYANTYPIALGLLAGGTLRAAGGGLHAQANAADQADDVEGQGAGRKMGGIENLVSHAYPLKHAVKAFETLANGKDAETGRGVVKVFITDDEP
ncbi:Alcohol dehydrogenase, C-terminal [Kalmanozyma brasiliensis GHG001]|uniref:Sorbitol dehydrogenase n=1 Tax=Kalmanozyma brasiliensis (strain GHG001) TaxID=1365824 RepID=V5F155_KALBG|nr:Alcohol dehydrogenase, C-terminal [Kalmanozyma brasiliensis GHG001]EST10028.1 Alcohol dehydrogenase, C-terminal [Kalmanozyma brasiliensis GHG001]